MYFRSILKESFKALQRNPVRSLLTVLGIAVGVATFICVVGIGNAATASVENQMKNLGDNFVWVEAGARARNGVRMGSRGSRTLVMGDAEAILRQVPLIKTAVPNADARIQVIYGNNNWYTQYRGVTPEYLEVRRWLLRLGTNFTNDDVTLASPVCLVGQTIVDNLFGQDDPLGKVIRMKDMPCKIIGVLAPKGASVTGQDQDDFIVMPINTAQKRLSGQFWLDDIYMSATTQEGMKDATDQIVKLLRERHHLNPGEDDDFNIRRPEDAIQAQIAATHVMTLLLASAASLSLLVGGIGIMNIMLVSVSQRTKEIGVRIAVGATEWDVQLQFLSEAVALGLFGGLAGVVAGFFSAGLVESTFHFPAQLTPEIFVIGATFSIGLAIVFGYYPARMASQLDPIQGLRYE